MINFLKTDDLLRLLLIALILAVIAEEFFWLGGVLLFL